MARIIDAFVQFLDGNGDPLVDGWLKFNETGTNNTDKDTFADVSQTIDNANPLQLDANGRCPNVFGSGSYNVISFADSIISPGTPGQQIQQFDPVGGDLDGSAFSDWNASSTYAIGDIVQGSDGEYYQSITNGNQNNNPTSSPTNWEELQLGRIWNSNVTYAATDSAYGSDGKLYTSLVGSNLNNDPVTDDGSSWAFGQYSKWNAALSYSKGDGATGSDNFLYFSLADTNLNNDPVTDATSTNWRASDQVRSAAAGGTVDAITATFIPAVGALKDGLMLRFGASGANTIAAPTFSPDGLTAKAIVKNGNQALSGDDIVAAGQECLVVYSSANDNWELLNPAQASALDVANFMHVQDQKAATTNGGNFATGAWRTRDLTTVVTNTIAGASLATNQITLPAGDYWVEASAPALRVNRHVIRLQNITDAAEEIHGTNESATSGADTMTRSFLRGLISIADTKDFEVQQQCQTTNALGFGLASGGSFTVTHETYTDIKIWKV